MSAADTYSWKLSNKQEQTKSLPVKSRRNYRINDMMQGGYTGNATWDLSGITNSSLYLDWLQTYLEIPLKLTVTTEDKSTAFASRFTASLKNGAYNPIHAIELKLANQVVVNMQPELQGRISYEMISMMSSDDAERAARFNYAFEDGTKFKYNATAHCDGLGNCVNSVLPSDLVALTAGTEDRPHNEGRKKRCMQLPNTTDNSALMSSAQLKEKNVSYRAANAGNVMTYNYICKIPMDILHSFFRNAPMARNAFYEINLQINTAKVACVLSTGTTVALGANAEAKTYNSVSVTECPYGFNPIQLGSLRFGDGMAAQDTATAALTAELSIGTADVAKCTLNASMVELHSKYEEDYLAAKQKFFVYDEVSVFRIFNIGAGLPHNQILTASSSRIRKLVMLPYFAADGIMPDAKLSPFDGFSAGFLSSPYAAVTDFNVSVAGQNVYPTNLTKTEDFYQNFCQMNLNGSVQSAVMNHGLISPEQYMTQYAAICVNLQRNQPPGTDDLSKNISIEFKNASQKTMSYIIYVYYEKTIGIDVANGLLLLENA
jgi:hypothetical protein